MARFLSRRSHNTMRGAFVSASFAVTLLAAKTAPAAVIDDHFTTNPTHNGWLVLKQSASKIDTSSADWDGSTNFTTALTTDSENLGGIGVIQTEQAHRIDMPNASLIRQRVTFGTTNGQSSTTGERLILASSYDDVYDGFKFDHYAFVQISNQSVQIKSSGNSNLFTINAISSGVTGPLASAGDWVEVVYDSQKVVSLRYHDASAAGGSGQTITLFQDDPNSTADNLLHGLNFADDFADGGFTALETYTTDSAKTVWDHVEVEVTPIPEPGALGLLGMSGMAALRRKRRSR